MHAAWHPSDPKRRAMLLQTLHSIDPTPLAGWTDVVSLVPAVRDAVGSAMYWQEPDDVDVLLRDREVRAALEPIAEALVRSPATAWWGEGVDLASLRFTASIEDDDEATPARIRRQSISWQRWRRELLQRSGDLRLTSAGPPATAASGFWWSTPSKPGVITTTRPIPGLGAVDLVWEEDTADPQTVAVWSMTAAGAPRIFEIDGPSAWVDLVRRYPLDTTGEHRGDWYRVTGRDGAWHTPDWAAAAADYDAVHLTVAGYLVTASRSLRVSSDGSVGTVLAGWGPDQTWWLNDLLEPATAPERWSRLDEFGQSDEHWRRTSG